MKLDNKIKDIKILSWEETLEELSIRHYGWTTEKWLKTFISHTLDHEIEKIREATVFIQSHSQLPGDIKEEHKAGWFLGHFDGLERLLKILRKYELLRVINNHLIKNHYGD